MSRSIVVALSLWALWALSTHAFAANPDVNCKSPEDQTTMNICANNDFNAADTKLNQSYAKVYKSISPQGQTKLKKAERAWVAWRDAQCDLDTSSTDSYSAQPMVHAMCLEHYTQEQTKRLDAALNCTEGDVSCHAK
jgi:uncharacterized protein YecT (DUF1311 family)